MSLVYNKKSLNSLDKWSLYFLVLGIIQAMWTNLYAFPPFVLRAVMIGAVFVPILLRRELMLFVFPFFLVLRGQLSTAYQYLPDSNTYIFYISILVLCLLIHQNQILPLNIKVFKPLISFTFYITIVDLISSGSIGVYSTNIFIVLILALFIKNKQDFDLLSLSFIMVCGLLAIYYIIMYDKFLVSWGASTGLERSGWSDPNYYSTLLSIGFQIAIFYLFGFLNSSFYFLKNRFILICICTIILGAVIMSASRGGFLCLAFGFIICFILLKPNVKIYMLTLAILVVVLNYMYSKGIFDVLLYRMFEQGNLETGGERTEIWGRVLNNFTLQGLFLQFFGGGYWYRTNLSGGFETHNEIIAILADYGYIGVIMFIILIFSMFIKHSTGTKVSVISIVFYCLSIISLSQFQYINYCFFIVWVLGYKMLLTQKKSR